MKKFETLEEHLANEVKDLIGKEVNVMYRKEILHRGIVLANTTSGIQIGITWTSLGIEKENGAKYISIFYARKSNLVATN